MSRCFLIITCLYISSFGFIKADEFDLKTYTFLNQILIDEKDTEKRKQRWKYTLKITDNSINLKHHINCLPKKDEFWTRQQIIKEILYPFSHQEDKLLVLSYWCKLSTSQEHIQFFWDRYPLITRYIRKPLFGKGIDERIAQDCFAAMVYKVAPENKRIEYVMEWWEKCCHGANRKWYGDFEKSFVRTVDLSSIDEKFDVLNKWVLKNNQLNNEDIIYLLSGCEERGYRLLEKIARGKLDVDTNLQYLAYTYLPYRIRKTLYKKIDAQAVFNRKKIGYRNGKYSSRVLDTYTYDLWKDTDIREFFKENMHDFLGKPSEETIRNPYKRRLQVDMRRLYVKHDFDNLKEFIKDYSLENYREIKEQNKLSNLQLTNVTLYRRAPLEKINDIYIVSRKRYYHNGFLEFAEKILLDEEVEMKTKIQALLHIYLTDTKESWTLYNELREKVDTNLLMEFKSYLDVFKKKMGKLKY